MELPHDLLYDILLYANGSALNSLCRLNKHTNNISTNPDFWKAKKDYFQYNQHNDMTNEYDRQSALFRVVTDKQNYYNTYTAIKKAQQFIIPDKYTQLITFINNNDYFLHKLFPVDIRIHDLCEHLRIVLHKNKITLKYHEVTVNLSKEDFINTLFYLFYTQKSINILSL